MAHSAGRSNGVVADENEMESECVCECGGLCRERLTVGLGGTSIGRSGGRADAGHLLDTYR